jgi:hypothetical protein
MDDADIKRTLKAARIPLNGRATEVVKRVAGRGLRRRPSESQEGVSGEAAATGTFDSASPRSPEKGRTDATERRILGIEISELRRSVRTSFCNSPHKRMYWTVLLDMYEESAGGKTTDDSPSKREE